MCILPLSLYDRKKRVFAHERDNVIKEEMQKLTVAKFIREVYYPDWLANVIMVKKANGKWRMCVDFTESKQGLPQGQLSIATY